MLRGLSSASKALTVQSRFSYLSVFGRPIDSLALNSLIELNIEVLRYASVQNAFMPLASVFVGGMALRLLMEAIGVMVKDIRFQNYGNRPLHGFINKVFMVDLQRDIRFYNIDNVRANSMKSYYTPNEIIKYLVNTYLAVNIGRSLNTLLVDQRYNSLLMLDPMVSLAALDITHITPVLIMLVNYLVLAGSTHPFLIHLRQRRLTMWNVAFMGGLLFVAMPIVIVRGIQLYNTTYIGAALMHVIIRFFKKMAINRKEASIRRMFQSQQP